MKQSNENQKSNPNYLDYSTTHDDQSNISHMIANKLTNKRAFSEREAADYIAMSPAFLRQDRMNGYRKNRTPGPHYIRIGRTIRYLKEDLDQWLERYRIERVAEY